MPGQLAILRAGPESTLGDELASWLASVGATAAAGGVGVVVLAGGEEGAVPEDALIELLTGPLGIGAVVPLLYGPQGQVLEAGSFIGRQWRHRPLRQPYGRGVTGAGFPSGHPR